MRDRVGMLVLGLICLAVVWWDYHHGPVGLFGTIVDARMLVAGLFLVALALFGLRFIKHIRNRSTRKK